MQLKLYQKNTRAVCFYLREVFAILSEGVDEATDEKEYVIDVDIMAGFAIVRDGEIYLPIGHRTI